MSNPSTSSPSFVSVSGSESGEGNFTALHRFDSPHHGTVELRNSSESDSQVEPVAADSHHEIDLSAIRTAHADDLVEYLQRWSEELDARSARLHADMATHERSERAFRLWMQNRRGEIETQLAEFQQAQARVEAAARRFALETDSTDPFLRGDERL